MLMWLLVPTAALRVQGLQPSNFPHILPIHPVAFQVAQWLKPRQQDPDDRSWRAQLFRLRNALFRGVNVDIHEDVASDVTIQAMREAAEHFDPRTEEVFKYLQVMGGPCMGRQEC
jgi:hypothetical protein